MKTTYKDFPSNATEQDMLWTMMDEIWPQHQQDTTPRTLGEELAEVERKAIVLALEHHCNNQSQAARSLGMGRTLLIHKMKKYDLMQVQNPT